MPILRQSLDSEGCEILKGVIIEGSRPGWIFFRSLWDDNDHALAGAGQEDSVGVLEVGLPFEFVDPLPAVSDE